MDLDVVVTAGLGDNSYLLISGREALAVDPQRDAWRLHQAADQRGATIRAVLETHVHNDYVSGAHEIRAATGAQIIAPAKGRYEFAHRPVDDGDELLLGDLRLVAMATPGHTFEHLAYLVYEGDATEPAAVLTGGSLLVGSAGRPDLLGATIPTSSPAPSTTACAGWPPCPPPHRCCPPTAPAASASPPCPPPAGPAPSTRNGATTRC